MNKHRIIVRITICIAALFICVVDALPAQATPYMNYTYNFWNERVPGPEAYLPDRVIDGSDFGIANFKNPQDLFVSSRGNIYILDTGNNRVVVLASDYKLLKVIDKFENDGLIGTFNRPEGIFVTQNEEIYIADTQNSRIVHLDSEGNFIREIGRPESKTDQYLSDTIRYQPKKLAVGKYGELYVLANNVFDGIMRFDLNGSFEGFIAAIRVSPSLADLFWRRIATQEQLARMSLVLPTEFTNLTIDHIGLLYTVNKDNIRRLSPVGKDLWDDSPSGDIGYAIFDPHDPLASSFKSNFVDIVARDYDMYSVLDSQLGRVFTYDSRGRLLYIFGGEGDQRGNFRVPIALDNLGPDLLVLDRETNQLTVFTPTEYATLIHQGIEFYNKGMYEEEIQVWHEVLKLNNNFDFAYSAIAGGLFLQGKFEDSLRYYRLANDRPGYSRVYYAHRRNRMIDNFAKVSTAALLLIVGFIFIDKLRLADKLKIWWRRLESEHFKKSKAYIYLRYEVITALAFARVVIFHPFSGFWELKRERKGNFIGGLIISILTVFAYVFQKQYTGFIFNTENLRFLNVYMEAATIVVPFSLWCIVSYAITTIFDGKGTIKDIFIATSYALTPLPLIMIPSTIISNYLVLDEGPFLQLALVISLVWALALLFFGSATIHEYTMGKNIVISISTLIGMGIVIFVALLFISIFEMIMDLAYNLSAEIRYRF